MCKVSISYWARVGARIPRNISHCQEVGKGSRETGQVKSG